MPKTATSFVFTSITPDVSARNVTFQYSSIFADATIENCKEIIEFPQEVFALPEAIQTKLFQTLHLMLGVSYWKRSCAEEIIVKTTILTQAQAAFWNTVYTKGLGEFFYKNQIDFRGLVQFPFANDAHVSPEHLAVSQVSLLPVGGGKDSIVAAEMLKKNGEEFAVFLLNAKDLQTEVSGVIGKPAEQVRRILDPKLLDTASDAYRGHVPMTAIYSTIALLVAAAKGYKAVVLANEHSSSYGNVEYLGTEINHQWSKSEEFETLFQDYVATNITKDIRVYSLLRDMDEMAIAAEFAHHPEYFAHFSSCNRNFATDPEKRLQGKKWCGECPKCAFVFVLMAAHLPKETVMKIFGKNLLADAALTNTYRELLGWQDVKPFECVGTPQEVTAAFARIIERGEFTADAIVQMHQAGKGQG